MIREKIFIAVLGIFLLGNMFGCDVGIHDAAKKGKVDIVKSLLAENPERINTKDKDGLTLLHVAVVQGHMDVAELLIAKGADVNARDEIGDTPLHKATIYRHKDVAELLIAKGADVNAKANNGGTPLDYAEASEALSRLPNADKLDFKDVIELLRRHGGKSEDSN
jgi:ankyrin repeat protein